MTTQLIDFITPSTDFGLKESDITFPVEAMSIVAHRTVETDGGPDYDPEMVAVAPAHKAIVRADTSEIVGIVGSKYSLMRNEDYFSTVETALREAIPAEFQRDALVRDKTTGSWSQREYVFPAYAKELKNTEFATKIGLRVVASNSYDGGSSARLMVGLIDFYCTNGMVIGKNIEKIARRHSSRLSPELFINPLKLSIDQSNEMVEHVRKMMRTPVKQDDVVILLEKHFSGSRAGQMVARFEKERDVRGNNVFALHSALTYYSSHNSEDFPTRGENFNSRILEAREEEVQRIVASPEFRRILEAA